MSKKEMKEWFVDCPWGRLAMVSWGNAADPPILAIHGYMDTAATFIPLLDHLPDSYFYVAIDCPGNGKSDPFPEGVLLTHAHLVEVIRISVKKMNWNKFIYMCHSMGCLMGIFYNAVFPGQILKMINLDSIGPFNLLMANNPAIIAKRYGDYYDNYEKYNNRTHRLYTHEQAVNAVARNRNLSSEQAEVVLSRVLIPAGEGLYRLSWDQKNKMITNQILSKDALIKLTTYKKLPTLNVIASQSLESTTPSALEFMEEVQEINENFLSVFVEGGHDVHLTNPEGVAAQIVEFLERDFNFTEVKSRL